MFGVLWTLKVCELSGFILLKDIIVRKLNIEYEGDRILMEKLF